MTEPLALVLYERILPGSQLVNRLQDMHYRVQTLSDPAKLVETAEEAKPLLVFADLHSSHTGVSEALAALKQNAGTKHLPIIAIGGEGTPDVQAAARVAGVSLIVNESAILTHLPQFMEQALQLE
jgi:CheY-like chemotaxis protein